MEIQLTLSEQEILNIVKAHLENSYKISDVAFQIHELGFSGYDIKIIAKTSE